MASKILVVDDFSKEAKSLRGTFDERYRDPRVARSDRFVWDYWHVPGQYTTLRTPAWEYFPKKSYEAFHERLVMWGRRMLGCHDVSPPWLSLYVEGCGQELHGDLPHGPYAFVFSLTRWQGRRFSGGETMVLNDDVLDYWEDFASTRSVETAALMTLVPARFNRLVVFDPRVPHGVRRVAGTQDPREGRLVIHGWFVQPRPFIEGPVAVSEVEQRIADLAGAVQVTAADLPVAGVLSMRIAVSTAGRVTGVNVLSDTTRVPASYESARRAMARAVVAAVKSFTFSKRRAASTITLPLVFER